MGHLIYQLSSTKIQYFAGNITSMAFLSSTKATSEGIREGDLGPLVLVVDDETELATQLTAAIEVLGYPVVAVHSAQDASKLLDATPGIMAVVSDIRMPGEDGLSFAARVMAARPGSEALAFIMITGHLGIDAATIAQRICRADLLQKPFRLAELNEALARAIRRASERREAARAARVNDASQPAPTEAGPGKGATH
jgi:DNA-binding NtrC family response regulator